MGYMEKFRRCGKCDERDQTIYEQGETPVSHLCDIENLPCCYLAQFECAIIIGEVEGEPDIHVVTNRDGKVYLRVPCEFSDPCVFKSIERYPLGGNCDPDSLGNGFAGSSDICCKAQSYVWKHNGQIVNYCDDNTTEQGDCQWYHRIGPLDGVTYGWELDLSQSPVTLTYPSLGYVYEATEAWVANAQNTMVKVAGDSKIPSNVCVVPKPVKTADEELEIYKFECQHDGVVNENFCDDALPCEYTDEDRLACCDPCCDCFKVTVNGDCSGTSVTNSGYACVGGRTGPGAAGVSREYCFSVNDGYGSHEICLVFYCDGAAWGMFVYCDGVFDSEGTVSAHTCCPLRFTFTFSVSCLECSFCGCVGEEDCDCEPATCCDLEGSTFNVTITPRAGCSCTTPATFTMSDGMTPGTWAGTTTVCGLAESPMYLTCGGDGVWTFTTDPVGQCSGDQTAVNEVDCPDLLLNFVFDCGGGCTWDVEVSN